MDKWDRLVDLAIDCHCGVKLARDLLRLAGGDFDLVREASQACPNGVESVKAYIIDRRIARIERNDSECK